MYLFFFFIVFFFLYFFFCIFFLFFFFFLIIPPPPRSTLFPYTTLFRSLHHAKIHIKNLANVIRNMTRVEEVRIEQDRKSTRLNSSHAHSSYAVFCLKKKNRLGDLPSAAVQRGTRDRYRTQQ